MSPYQRRFGGVGRLFGAEGLERLRSAHACVVGLGGVGSWVVEGLVRSGIGELTLIDLDDVCISNVGTAAFVTGAFGLVAAARVVEKITRTHVVSGLSPGVEGASRRPVL